MGILEAPRSSLSSALFSPVQEKVLGLLFGQPDRSFRGSEVIQRAASGTGAVHRQLVRLADCGLVKVNRVGNQRHYQANRESPVFAELSGLIRKTVGLTEPLKRALEPLEVKIRAAFIYGSVASGEEGAGSDVDVMVISDQVRSAELFTALDGAEAALGRTINPHLITPGDWKKKLKQDHPFVTKVNRRPKLFLVGSEHDLA